MFFIGGKSMEDMIINVEVVVIQNTIKHMEIMRKYIVHIINLIIGQMKVVTTIEVVS